MRTFKTLKKALPAMLVLVTFAAVSLASSSKKEAVEAVDGFVDGWQMGRDMSSTETLPVDTVMQQSVNDVALNK